MSTTMVASDRCIKNLNSWLVGLYKTISSAGSAVVPIGCCVVGSLIALGFTSFRQQGWPDQLLPPYFCLQKNGSSDLLVVLSIRLDISTKFFFY